MPRVALATDYDVWHPEHDAVTVEAVIAQPREERGDGARTSCGAPSPRVSARACTRRLPRGARSRRVITRPAAIPPRDAQAPRAPRRALPPARRAEDRRGDGPRRADDGRVTSTWSASATRSSTCSATPPRSSCATRTCVKGTMHLVDEARARALYEAMGPGIEMSGGSAANTIVGVASFGGRAHYVGKVRDDQLGEVFAHDLRSTGVGYTTPPGHGGPPTGRCLILITPDAQRTMHTFLGASAQLGPGDIDEALIARGPRSSTSRAISSTRPRPRKPSGSPPASRTPRDGKVSLTLSDPFCVDRHRAAFLDLVEHHVDVLFANEAEICALYQVSDFDAALAAGARSLRDRRPHARASAARSSSRGDEVHVVDGPPGGRGRRHHRRRRSLRRRFPLRPEPRTGPADLRPSRFARRRRGHHPRGRAARLAPGPARGVTWTPTPPPSTRAWWIYSGRWTGWWSPSRAGWIPPCSGAPPRTPSASGPLLATADSETYPASELDEARRLAESIGLRHLIVQTHELERPEYARNAPNRCFFCKDELFTRLEAVAREHGGMPDRLRRHHGRPRRPPTRHGSGEGQGRARAVDRGRAVEARGARDRTARSGCPIGTSPPSRACPRASSTATPSRPRSSGRWTRPRPFCAS